LDECRLRAIQKGRRRATQIQNTSSLYGDRKIKTLDLDALAKKRAKVKSWNMGLKDWSE